MKLSTIQKRNNLNTVNATDEVGAGNANHQYKIGIHETEETLCEIQFQHGARFSEGATAGVLDSDLLEIVRHRLQGFQSGEYATQENAYMLMHIEEALMWSNKRAEDRAERQVLGTMQK